MKISNSLPSDKELWFDDINYQEHDYYLKLSNSQKLLVDEMHQNGIIVIKNSVSETIVDDALRFEREWIELNKDIYEQNRKPDGTPPRIVDFHREDQSISRLFIENSSLEIQDILFQAKTSIYTSLFFATSTQQPMHRDVPVFCTSPYNFYFGMWVALEDTTLENGALRVYKGGHKVHIDQYEIPKKFGMEYFDIPQQSTELWNAYQSEVDAACRGLELDLVTVNVGKGDTVIWHPLLPHSGGKIIRSGATRHSIVFHTVPEGVPVYRSNVFFNPHSRYVTSQSRFNYAEVGNSRVTADFGQCKLRNR